VLLIGVEDRTRYVRGVDAPPDAEELRANVIADGVSPRLVPELEILPWRRTDILTVEVHASTSRPDHLKSEGKDRAPTYVSGPPTAARTLNWSRSFAALRMVRPLISRRCRTSTRTTIPVAAKEGT